MKVVLDKPRSVIVYGSFDENAPSSIVLTDKNGTVTSLGPGRVRRTFAEFFIPAQYITASTLPMDAVVTVDGAVVRNITFTANNHPPINEADLVIEYNNGWASRPVEAESVIWIGGDVMNVPPQQAFNGKDWWLVPVSPTDS